MNRRNNNRASRPGRTDRWATLSKTTFIQRVNTEGGIAPATGCEQATDIGKKVFVPYTADYIFYKQ